jgi:hypothetical protein
MWNWFLVTAINLIIEFGPLNIDISGPPAFCIRSTGKPFDIGSGPFTVLMIDIGPATPEKSGNPSLVLAGSDFKFKDDGNCLANNTPAVMEYEAPKPSEGSQPHQYVKGRHLHCSCTTYLI